MKLGILKHYFRRYVLQHFRNSDRVIIELNKLKKVNLMVNNFCNLSCFSCVSRCDKPIGGDSFRDEMREYVPSNLKKFLDMYVDMDAVVFIGGEPTLSSEVLKDLAIIVRDYGKLTVLFTNGCKYFEPFLFDYVILDNHGVNEGDIRDVVRYFEMIDYKNYFVKDTLRHYDIEYAMKGFSKGVMCKNFLEIGLWLDVVYPCKCNLMVMDGWTGSDYEVENSLRASGWCVDNKELLEVIGDWRESIPEIVYERCLVDCWITGKRLWKGV